MATLILPPLLLLAGHAAAALWPVVQQPAPSVAPTSAAAKAPAAAPAPGLPNTGNATAPTTPPSETWAPKARAFGGYEWVSRPSRDAIMGFTQPMEVEKVEVVGGQKVTRDQVLVRGREGEVVAALDVQRTKATNKGPVDAAKANEELAQIRFDAAERAIKEVGMSPYEFQERRLALESAKAQRISAESDFRQEQQRVKQAEESVERYRIRARFDGIVELVVAEAGQTIDIQQPVIRIVSVDPLWIDVPVPADDTIRSRVAAGADAAVLLDVPSDKPQGEVLAGKVLYISPVVDAAGTRRVRVEAANPAQWPAGTRVRVKFAPAPRTDNAPAAAAAQEPA
jgi:multidrug efflux pump subunit AcrA (membrane-fusion protein)